MTLPKEIAESALHVGGEVAWQLSKAADAIRVLSRSGYAILGIEVWLLEDHNPTVWGWSTYEVSFDGSWENFVERNAVSALKELEKPLPPQSLINLTFIGREELEATDRESPPRF